MLCQSGNRGQELRWASERRNSSRRGGNSTGMYLGGSGGVVNSLDFCPASLKSLGCFYFWCVFSSRSSGQPKNDAKTLFFHPPSPFPGNFVLLRNSRFNFPCYWAIQAGLLTPLTFARHRLSPLAAFTSGAYFLHNGRR